MGWDWGFMVASVDGCWVWRSVGGSGKKTRRGEEEEEDKE